MLHNYLLEDNKIYSIHLMLTDQCNNRCLYCGQYAPYSDKEFNIEDLKKTINFFRDGLKGRKYKFFLEGGEPTLYSNLEEILNFFSSNNEKVVLLSNGRIPKSKYALITHNLKVGVIEHIGLHLPVGKEPFFDIWKEEVEIFLEYLTQSGITKRIIFLGILNSINVCLKDVWSLLKWIQLFPQLFLGLEVAFPHPNPLVKDYMDYKSRILSMKYLMRFFDFCLTNNIKIALGGFMLCLIDIGVQLNSGKFTRVKDYFVSMKTDISKNIEIHIKNTGETVLLCNLLKGTFLNTDSIFSYANYHDYENSINKSIIEEFSKRNPSIPPQCMRCNYLGNGCSGDHFNLVTEFNEKGYSIDNLVG